MYSDRLLHMNASELVDLQILIYIGSVRTLDAFLRTGLRWWTIGIDDEKENQETLCYHHLKDDDDDDYMSIHKYIYI